MIKLIFVFFILLPNLATGQGQFFKDSEEVLTEDDLYEEDADFGVPTDRNLDKRTRQLRKKVEELEIRVKHLESQGEMKALKFYTCNLLAGLAGNYSAKAESREKALENVIKKCRDASSNSALCNETNAQCQQR